MCRERCDARAGVLTLCILMGAAGNLAGAAASRTEETAVQRPDPDGRPTRISIRVYVVDVAEVNDSRRTFSADVYILFQWRDPRLAKPDTSRRLLPLTAVWHPPLLILNQRSVNRLLPEVVEVDRLGNVGYRQRYQGDFSVPLDLSNFPLDEQTLAVRMVSPGYSPADLDLVADEQGGRAKQFSILDWSLAQPASDATPLETPDGRKIASFTCTLVARRQALAYVYQFLIPLIFIVCMSWAAFWMPPEQLAPRQGIAVTSMLTIIAYRFVLANQLPRVTYLTRFDYLLLGCTTLVFLVLVEVVTAHRMLTRGHPERARKLDVGARCVFPALFLLLLVGIVAL